MPSFLMAEEYPTVYVYHIYFIFSPADGHLGRYHVVVTVNNAAMTMAGGGGSHLWEIAISSH